MATARSGVLRRPAPPVARAQPVARPALPISAMTGEQLIAEIANREKASAAASYALGLCLRELSQPRRYRDELGMKSFEELLIARKLVSRMTAHKLITVVSAYAEREVDQLGGMEKCYALIRLLKKQGTGGDPKRLLLPNARVFGRLVTSVSARDLARLSASGGSTTAVDTTAAKKAASRLRSALKGAGVAHRTRVHAHDGACVSAHFTPAEANELSDALARLKKLEKKLGST